MDYATKDLINFSLRDTQKSKFPAGEKKIILRTIKKLEKFNYVHNKLTKTLNQKLYAQSP